MSWAGCYDLTLACDGPHGERDGETYEKGCRAGLYRNQVVGKFTDEFGRRCRAMARKAGWYFDLTGRCMCPACKPIFFRMREDRSAGKHRKPR